MTRVRRKCVFPHTPLEIGHRKPCAPVRRRAAFESIGTLADRLSTAYAALLLLRGHDPLAYDLPDRPTHDPFL